MSGSVESSNPNSSLFPPSDINPSLQITQHKLNGLNFHEWFQSVLLVIRGKGKTGYLTGETEAPNKKDAHYKIWEAENSIVMAWLVNSMNPNIGRTYLYYNTAHEIWKAVQEMYSDLENTSQCFEIRSALRSTNQGGRSVTEYYNVLTELWQEMDVFYHINWSCPQDGTLHAKMLEKDRIFDFLQGLNKELDEVRGRILGTKPLPSLREVFAEVRREESLAKVMLHTLISIDVEGSALVAYRSEGQKNSKSSNAKVWCEH
ncbi:hypothetical protein Lser_V15G32577 [Lactuca serriola]